MNGFGRWSKVRQYATMVICISIMACSFFAIVLLGKWWAMAPFFLCWIVLDRAMAAK